MKGGGWSETMGDRLGQTMVSSNILFGYKGLQIPLNEHNQQGHMTWFSLLCKTNDNTERGLFGGGGGGE